MKATIEFNLPDDQGDYRAAIRAQDYWHALTEINERLRSRLKYIELTDETRRELESVRELIPYELLQWCEG